MVIVGCCCTLFRGLFEPIIVVNVIDHVCDIAVNDHFYTYLSLEMLAVFATRAPASAFLYYEITE
jgi:hypothetical protein